LGVYLAAGCEQKTIPYRFIEQVGNNMRLPLIDGLRGYFLIMMMMTHLTLVRPNLSLFSHQKFGFVEDAQGFVFLSGFVIALVYGRLLQKTSFEIMRVKLYSRIKQLYVYNFVSLAIVFALAFSGFKFSDELKEMAGIGHNVWEDVTISLLLIDGPHYVDILPMYICFMLITPFVLRALWSDGLAVVIAISVSLWVVAQSGVFIWIANHATEALNLTGDGGLDLSLYFYRWSWQILFVGGLVGGALFAQGKLDLLRLHESRFETLFYFSLLGIIFFMLLKFSITKNFGWISIESEFSRTGLNRSNLGILRLVNFIIDAYAVIYLVVVGPTSKHKWIAILGRFLKAVFSWRPLVFLGQNSLQVYALHVVLVYLVAAAVFQFDLPIGAGMGDVILISCWGMLFVPGLLKARRVAV
jgi:hypothetical protein